MLQGSQSVQMYRKAIETLKHDLNKPGQDQTLLINQQMSSAYASIAEIYMTELCDEPDAEQVCNDSLKTGLETSPNNIDCLQNLANLRMLRNQDQEAATYLMQVKSIILNNGGED